MQLGANGEQLKLVFGTGVQVVVGFETMHADDGPGEPVVMQTPPHGSPGVLISVGVHVNGVGQVDLGSFTAQGVVVGVDMRATQDPRQLSDVQLAVIGEQLNPVEGEQVVTALLIRQPAEGPGGAVVMQRPPHGFPGVVVTVGVPASSSRQVLTPGEGAYVQINGVGQVEVVAPPTHGVKDGRTENEVHTPCHG